MPVAQTTPSRHMAMRACIVAYPQQHSQKHITAQRISKEGLANIGPAVATLAAVEKLDAHRNAVLIRQGQLN